MTEESSDVWRAIEGLRAQDVHHSTTAMGIETALGELKSMVQGLVDAVGATSMDERGHPIGTGIKGDVMRIRLKVEQQRSFIEGLRKYATGFAAAMAVSIAIVWWLVADKMEHVFK